MNIELEHNVTFRRWRQYLEDDGETPINCTGGSLAAEVRTEAGGELLGTFTFEWVNIGLGTFYQVMPAAAVNAIPDGVYRWDLLFTDALGEVHKIDQGTCTKSGTITEP
jgi:hypothetical protein